MMIKRKVCEEVKKHLENVSFIDEQKGGFNNNKLKGLTQ